MNLSKRAVVIVAVLIVAALSGLTALQIYLLMNAYEQRDQAFERNVWAALGTATQKLEACEAASYTMDEIGKGDRAVSREEVVRSGPALHGDSLKAIGVFLDSCDTAGGPVLMQNKNLVYSLSSPQHVTIRMLDPLTGIDRILVDSLRGAGTHQVSLSGVSSGQQMAYFTFQSDSSSTVFTLSSGDTTGSMYSWISQSSKGELMRRVVTNLVVGEFEPIEKRLKRVDLDSLLQTSLHQSGIDIKAEYAVATAADDSLRLISNAAYEPALRSSNFVTQLFPSDLFGTKSNLKVFFPNRQVYIWKQMGPLLFLTVLFVSVIALCFVYTIRVIVHQRRFAGRLVDFINNMTHEFKTPISTVLLACDALLRSDTVGDQQRLERYGGMIKDESMRMRSQVEKILQMAVLEDGNSELSLKPMHLHEIVTKAAANFKLQAESRHGSVTLELNAERDEINADETHFPNVINNILDNALKYSEDHIQITVATSLHDNRIRLAVADKGIGLSADDLKSVFDKYYRVSSGNIHNAKGFGLGLTYVKLIVEAHHGSVSLDSELGKGTTVTIDLPLAATAERTNG